MFNSLYCGVCMMIKTEYGNLPRLTTNYDITVFGLIALEAVKPKITFTNSRCALNPRKKAIVSGNDFLKKLCAVNILLTYYKAFDDEVDSGGKKKLVRKILSPSYRTAKEIMPDADNIIANGYKKLRVLEAKNSAELDIVCDCFASILSELISDFILKSGVEIVDNYDILLSQTEGAEYKLHRNELDTFKRLCYNIGKFVYLADALDDIDDDKKKGNYNPFLALHSDYVRNRRSELMHKYGSKIEFAFNSTVNRAIECSNRLVFTEVNGLLRNVIYEGLRAKTNELFAANKKLPLPRLRITKQTGEQSENEKSV